MQKNNDFLGKDPIGRLLFRLAIPTVAAQLINMLYNIVDRIYIGHMPVNGDVALTGVGLCMPIILIVSAFAALISSGGAPRASIAMGRGDNTAAERILGGCLLLQSIVALLLTAVVLIWHRPMLFAFGASANTVEYAADYLQIYALGTLFVQLTLGMNSFITAQGFARTGMLTVLIGAVLNIILDPIFIFTLDMGVHGAALATILSQAVSCIWVLVFLSSPRSLLRIRRQNLRLQGRILLPCIALGCSPFVMQISESVISMCFNASLQRYGGDIAVGAMTILSSVMQFALMPLQGLAQGAQPIISYNYGANHTERVKQIFWLLLKSSLIYSLALWALIMLFPSGFAGLFTPEPALRSFAADALRIYCAVLGIFGIQIACQMTFVSIGNAASSILVAVMRKFILLIPLIYIMPQLMQDKTTAVYTAEPVADFLSVTFTVILFSSQFRKAIRRMESPKGKA